MKKHNLSVISSQMPQHYQGNVCVFLQSITVSTASTLSLKPTDIFRQKFFFLHIFLHCVYSFMCERKHYHV